MPNPFGSISERRQQMEEAMRGTAPATSQPSHWPPAGFVPPQGGWPSNLGDIWGRLRDYQQRPGFPGSLSDEQRNFYEQWNPFMPPVGTPLSPELQGIVGRPTAFDFNPNVGPTMASAPSGQYGPAAPWGVRQPAQAEATPMWAPAGLLDFPDRTGRSPSPAMA